MAAPQESPDLGVIENESPAVPKPVAPEPATAGDEPKARRSGVPIWAVLLVAVVGAVLFLSQYQRAQGLDAQVVALRGELAEVGEQLDAYQSHLETVRTSVSDLKGRIGHLDQLVSSDPLAPQLEDEIDLGAPTFMPTGEQGAIAPGAGARDESVLGPAIATPVAPEEASEGAEAERQEISPFGPGFQL